MGATPHPNNLRAAIPEGPLRELYVQQRRTLAQVANEFGTAPITVRRRLRDLGIPARPRGPIPAWWTSTGPRTQPLWTADLGWIVGLIATDGNLSRDRWGLALSSKDVDLLDTARRCLGLNNSITPYSNGRCYHIQWRDRVFYDWLLGLGLTPAKSLTLGPLAIPDDYFADFFRGCVDGDGSVLVYSDRYHTVKKEHYVYERLYVSLVSASSRFLDWIRGRVRVLAGVDGDLSERTKEGRHSLWRLRYAKAESIRVIRWMYYAPNVPCLARKHAKAERFLSPLGHSPSRSVGRPRIGWLYNARVT